MTVDWEAGNQPSYVTINDRQLSWRELCDLLREEMVELGKWRTLVQDLDRSPHGRHEGDAEFQDPSGVSQGNPHLKVGQIFGYDISGKPIVLPPREQRHLIEAWRGAKNA